MPHQAPFAHPFLLLQAPRSRTGEQRAREAAGEQAVLSGPRKRLAAAALASLQIAAVPFAADLAQPAPAAAVLNSPNARIARRYISLGPTCDMYMEQSFHDRPTSTSTT